MQNQQAARIADLILSVVGRRGESLGGVLQYVHGFSQGENFKSFAHRVVAPAVAFIRSPEDVLYVSVDRDESVDDLTVSGGAMIVTTTNLVELTFETANNNRTAPTASATAWKRSDIDRVVLTGVTAPVLTDPDDLTEPWAPIATMDLHLQRGKRITLTSRFDDGAAFIELASELSK